MIVASGIAETASATRRGSESSSASQVEGRGNGEGGSVPDESQGLRTGWMQDVVDRVEIEPVEPVHADRVVEKRDGAVSVPGTNLCVSDQAFRVSMHRVGVVFEDIVLRFLRPPIR